MRINWSLNCISFSYWNSLIWRLLFHWDSVLLRIKRGNNWILILRAIIRLWSRFFQRRKGFRSLWFYQISKVFLRLNQIILLSGYGIALIIELILLNEVCFLQPNRTYIYAFRLLWLFNFLLILVISVEVTLYLFILKVLKIERRNTREKLLTTNNLVMRLIMILWYRLQTPWQIFIWLEIFMRLINR